MIRHIKTAKATTHDGGADSAVTTAVEALLATVRDGGDRAVRELSVRFDGFDRDSYRLTRQEIGSLLGVAFETVSRCLSGFEKRRMIRVFGRHVQLLDPPSLRKLAGSLAETGETP